GLTSPRAQRLLGARFRSSRGVHGGINRGRADPDYLGSVEIRGHSQLEEMTAWVDDVVATPGWLIFFTHDVNDPPSEYGCPPDLLDGLAGYAVSAGCALLTVDAALDRIGVAR
ncbi:MAG TPA: polysaccharide deacetylase, partial [Devosia sp.]|nr:polysaccharide deacetylase [Devosia sp.]